MAVAGLKLKVTKEQSAEFIRLMKQADEAGCILFRESSG